MEHRMEAFYQLWVLMEKRKEEIDMECKYEQSYQSDCYKIADPVYQQRA